MYVFTFSTLNNIYLKLVSIMKEQVASIVFCYISKTFSNSIMELTTEYKILCSFFSNLDEDSALV